MVKKSNVQLETTVTFQVTVFGHQSLDIKFCDFLLYIFCYIFEIFITFGAFETCGTFETFRTLKTFGNLKHLRPFVTICNRCEHSRPFATSSDHFRSFAMFWDCLRPFATVCDYLRRFLTICDRLRTLYFWLTVISFISLYSVYLWFYLWFYFNGEMWHLKGSPVHIKT